MFKQRVSTFREEIKRSHVGQRRVDDQIGHVNRALRTLSECNQALVRATDENSLLQKVCQILVETGGYRLAWVGYVEQDEAKTVRPVAQAGYEAGYLESLHLSWADTPRGRGPGGRAIRTGKPVFVNSVSTDPSVEPFRTEALKRGYASVIALPLHVEAQTIGILAIYSEKTNAFDVEEANLLSELAADLAFGIAALRTRIAHQQAEESLRASEARYRFLFDSMLNGFALHEVICDATGKPIDYRFLEVNPAFENLTGLRAADIIGKTVFEVLPGTESFWIERYGTVALTGQPDAFVHYSHELNRYYSVNAFSPKRGQFGVIFEDVSDRTRAEEALRRRAEELSALQATLLEITAPHALPNLLRTIVERATTLLAAQSGGMYLCDPERQEALCVVSYNTPSDYTGTVLKYGEGAAGLVAQTGEPLIIEDYRAWSGRAAVYEDDQPFSRVVSTPMLWQGRVTGVIHVMRSADANPFTRDELGLLTTFANHAAIAVENARLVGGLELELTERKQAEEALRQSEENFQNAFEYAAIGMGLVAPDGHWLRVNESLCRLTGYSREELLTKSFQEITHPDDLDADLEYVRQMLAGEIDTYQMEKRYIHKCGHLVWVLLSVSLVWDHQKQPLYFISQIEDITERKRSGEKLRESERRHRALVENSSDQVCVLAPDGSMLFAGPSEQPILGYSADEFIGRNLFQLVHPDDLERIQSKFNQVVKDPTFHPREQFRLLASDRNWHWIEAVSMNLLDEPSVGGIVVNYHDVSERKQAQDRIETQLRRFEALHAIDLAITGSIDFRLALNVVLAQATAQLGMHASSVLLVTPYSQTLSYAAGRGFHTRGIEQSQERIGEGIASRAIFKRKVVHLHDPLDSPDFPRAALLANEGFVEYYAAPLIVKGNVVGVLEVFHRAPFEGDDEWKLFLETLATQTAIAIDNTRLFESLQRSNMNLMLAYDTTIEGWSRALDLRDKETEGHTQRVTNLTVELAHAMGISDTDIGHIRRGALLHDIGKMGVPDHILHKPAALTEEEWAVMRQHTTLANELLSQIEFLRPALDIPYCHHEKWDGTGYPRGLKGEQIPVAARIFAIVDVYDALRSDRPYRKGWTKKKTLDYIRSQAGSHFDPRVAEAFLGMMKEKK